MIEPPAEIDRESLFVRLAAIAPGAAGEVAVLCASPRLAQFLHDAFAAWQLRRGVEAWATPPMSTPEALLHSIEERGRAVDPSRSAAPEPLSDSESAFLWRMVVSEVRGPQPLLREAEAAQLAAEAWRLCHDHGLTLPLSASNPDVDRFNQWARRYRERCERLGRVDAAVRRRELIEAIARGEAELPRTAILAGLDAAPPWVDDLSRALQLRGVSVLRLAPRRCRGQVRACSAAGAEPELRAAAAWVREQALAAPEARIGVIVPDLQARRADLQRVFDQALCPALDTLAGAAGERPYNLSLGERLADVGVVQCGLSLLRLCVGALDLAECGSLLCEPYWGERESDRLLRAELDRALREAGHLSVDLALLGRLARRMPALQPTLDRLQQLRGTHGAADADVWCERFSHWLDAAGWPGPRLLDSHEYQAVEAWRGLLRDLARIGRVAGRMAASAALVQLQQLAQQRVFQPQTPALHIQVLGALEAEGLEFDALWVMGLDDERWPARRSPNPFIPFELQRRCGLPHASPAHDLAWAERLTERWREAAVKVVFSWPTQADDRTLSPSPLILAEAILATPAGADPLAPAWRAARTRGEFAALADAYGPAPDTAAAVPGGARLLGDQARCPFRAFATHRLGVRPLPQPGYGPSAADRGVLVHRVLERLWHALRDQGRLLALDQATLDRDIGAAVAVELARLADEAPQRFPDGMRALEAARVEALVGAWMTLERQRAPFVVEQIEGATPGDLQAASRDAGLVRFGELLLRLRPDRVDRLADGSRLVLDYKTGARRPAPWRDGRPDEPQLLLYGLTRSGVAGVAYARLRAGAVGFDGLAESAELAPGLTVFSENRETRDAASWSALLGRWRGELETLAGEVRRGLAGVTPRHVRQSCRDCHLHAACRIREHVDAAAFDDDAEAPT